MITRQQIVMVMSRKWVYTHVVSNQTLYVNWIVWWWRRGRRVDLTLRILVSRWAILSLSYKKILLNLVKWKCCLIKQCKRNVFIRSFFCVMCSLAYHFNQFYFYNIIFFILHFLNQRPTYMPQVCKSTSCTINFMRGVWGVWDMYDSKCRT